MNLSDELVQSYARGVNDAAAPSDYQPNEVQRLINGRVTLQGNSIRRRGGSFSPQGTAFIVGSQATCYGGIEYTTAAGTVQWVVFFDDEMHTSEDQGATWTQRATGLTEAFWDLVIYREGSSNVLVCANGGTNTYQWDGTTWGTVSNIPNNVKYLAVMGDRLIAAGHSGVDVVASRVSDIDNGYGVTSGGWSVKATTHDGDVEIRNIYTFGSVVMVFKTRSVGYIEGFGYQTLQVEAGARGISRSVGLAAPFSIAPLGESALMWLSELGFVYYQIGAAPVLVSGRMQSFIDSIMWDVLEDAPDLPHAVWWSRRREYHCTVPVGTERGRVTAGSDEQLCHYTFVFRPPTPDGEPAAMWCQRMTNAASEEGGGFPESQLAVDSQNRLCVVDDGAGFDAVTIDGALALAEGNEYGVTVTADASTAGSILTLLGSIYSPVVLFTAQWGGDPTRPIAAGWGGRVWVLGENGPDAQIEGNNQYIDITLRVRTRPFLFGVQALKKKFKRFFLQSSQPSSVAVTATTRSDGVQKAAQTMTMGAVASGRPDEQMIRTGGRGFVHEVDLAATGDIEILAMQASAEPLRKTR